MTPLLTALAIFLGAILLAGIVAYFVPFIQRPARGMATNWLFNISLPRSLAYPAAVLAQERYEQQWKLRHLIVIGSKRKMELMSHAIECAAAELIYGLDPLVYAMAEAKRMFDAIGRSYGHLSGMTVESIYAALVARLPRARILVAAEREWLEGYR